MYTVSIIFESYLYVKLSRYLSQKDRRPINLDNIEFLLQAYCVSKENVTIFFQINM